MDKIKLYWEFHKSTLTINWVLSGVFAILSIDPSWMPYTFAYVSMTGGPFISIFYKEISFQNEYYFYYNRGISKLSLILTSMILNIITGKIILAIIAHV